MFLWRTVALWCSINYHHSQSLCEEIHLSKTRKDPSCCHLFRTWKLLKLCIIALIVLIIITSDQMRVTLINGHTHIAKVAFWFDCLMLALIMSHVDDSVVVVTTVMGLQTLFSCPAQTYGPGWTCGQVSMVVTLVATIIAPGWCNDKGGAWLSLISSSISIYYPHRHEHHHTVAVAARCNLAIRRAFPAAALPHVQRSSTYPAVFLFLSCRSLHCNLETPTSAFRVNRDILGLRSCRLPLFHMIIYCCGSLGGVACVESVACHIVLWCGTVVRAGSFVLSLIGVCPLARALGWSPSIISVSYVANRKHVCAGTAGSGERFCACHDLTESVIVPLRHSIVFNCLMCSGGVW